MGSGVVAENNKELAAAINAGFETDKIVFNSSIFEDEFELAVKNNSLIIIDPNQDLEKIVFASQVTEKKARVLIKLDSELEQE